MMTIKISALVAGITSLAFPVVCLPQSAENTNLEAGRLDYKQGDYAGALKLLTPLAQQGNAEAQTQLGVMSLKGQGVDKNPSQALKWFLGSAELGNAEGQFYAGAIYLMGAGGIPHDTALGLKWLGASANQGSPDAQVLLGLTYLQGGGGVPRDLVQADLWLRLAADHGDPLAPKQVEIVEKQMSVEELAKAKALIAAWKPNIAPEHKSGKKQ